MGRSINEVDVIAIDQGSLQRAVSDLIKSSILKEKVYEVPRPSMFGSGMVIEFRPNEGLPVAVWSSGERALWAFLNSVARGHLRELGGHFKGSPEAASIIEIFRSLMNSE